MLSERFFLAGCQRSGTTMLRLALESHPKIQCFDEVLAYRTLSGENTCGKKELQTGNGLVGFKIPRFSEQFLWPSCVDPDYGRFPSFYRGEKVIFIVRNVLDVVSSMITLSADNGLSWLERYGRQILLHVLTHGFANDSLRKASDGIALERLPLHLIGALYWINKNHGLLDLIEHRAPVLVVNYEEVVSRPREVLSGVCDFLGVEWSDEVLNHPDHEHGELYEDGKTIGSTDPKRQIDTASLGRFSKVLGEGECREIKEVTAEFRAKLDRQFDK
jgi:hypothetical protein